MRTSDIRQNLIAIGFMLLEEGLVTGTAGNISARCNDELSFFITPTGRDYRLLTEQDLVRIHFPSGEAKGRWKPSSEWRLHAGIYQVRPDVNAIIHHHATWASAVAVARKTIPILIDEAADIGPIPTVSYAPSGSQELARVTAEQFASGSNAALLANHGAVVVGRDLGEVLWRALEVERLAKIYIGAELLGGAHPLDEVAVDQSRRFLEGYRKEEVRYRNSTGAHHYIIGHVGLQDLLNYGFQAGITFASLVHALILQKLHMRQ